MWRWFNPIYIHKFQSNLKTSSKQTGITAQSAQLGGIQEDPQRLRSWRVEDCRDVRDRSRVDWKLYLHRARTAGFHLRKSGCVKPERWRAEQVWHVPCRTNEKFRYAPGQILQVLHGNAGQSNFTRDSLDWHLQGPRVQERRSAEHLVDCNALVADDFVLLRKTWLFWASCTLQKSQPDDPEVGQIRAPRPYADSVTERRRD